MQIDKQHYNEDGSLWKNCATCSKGYDNITEKFKGGTELKDIVQVYNVSDKNVQIFNDLKTEHFLLTC